MSSIWIVILLQMLAYLIQWLMSLERQLRDGELRKVNKAIYLAREFEAAAIRRGATPGGFPDDK